MANRTSRSPGRAQRHHHGLRLCADRGAPAWSVFDNGAVVDPLSLGRPLHRRAGDRRPALAAIAAGTWGRVGPRTDPPQASADLSPRTVGDPGAAVRVPGRAD